MPKGFQSKPSSNLDEARQPSTWSVWRQDDSGNRFLVEANLTEAQAKSMAADLEARGHKQTYWASDEHIGP